MSTTTPDKLTWPKGTKATLAPARTIPAQTFPMDQGLDFTHASLRWHDDPNGQMLSVTLPPLPGAIKIMGTGAKTAYNPTWNEQDARAALLAQLALPSPS